MSAVQARRVLVTGATGCVGRQALPLLVDRGWDVLGVHSRTPPPAIRGVEWRQADLLDSGQVTALISQARPSHLLHLAWYIAPGRWAAAPENYSWVRASLDLATTFKAAGGTRMVSAGSCLEYDWNAGVCAEGSTPLVPHTVYGTCKHATELVTSSLMSGQGTSSAWGRIFFLYGPHEHPDRLVSSVIRSILAGQPARTSHGEQIRDYLYAADVADAFVQLLDSDVTGPVNIASGEQIALKHIVVRIGHLMGRQDLIQLGAIPAASTDTPLVVADTSRLASALGWTPSWTLDRGLTATIDWWRNQQLTAGKEHQ